MKPERLATQLEDVADEETLAAVWRSVQHGREVRRRRRVALRVSSIAALMVALVVGAIVARRPPTLEPLTREDASPLDGRLSGLVVLSDASRVSVEPDARLELVGNSGPRLQFHLREGRARFEVTPGTGRHWEVSAGELSVEVVGTVFSVERRSGGTAVIVERGAVLVRGARVPDQLVRLVAGQRFELPAVEASAPAPAAGPRGDEVVAEPVATPAPGATNAGKGVVARQREPVAPAEETVAPAQGVEPSVQTPATLETPGELLSRADQQRREGRADDAVHTLTSVVQQFPTSPEAALAAFTLGRLATERGDVRSAQTWYARALELGLPAPLADTASRNLAASELDGGQ
ncbi:MAG: FecR domain-containing protein [Myxococcota bacterium]